MNQPPFKKILSVNLCCGTLITPIPYFRLKKQIKLIQKWDPDVICLQEFNNIWIEYYYRHRLKSKYYFYLERDYLRLFLNLSIYLVLILVAIHVKPAILFFLLYPYWSLFVLGSQKTGNVILVKKTLKIKPTEFYTQYFINQEGDFLNLVRPRGYSIIKWDEWALYNIHLNRIDGIQEQIHELLEIINGPCIVAGDFNTSDIQTIIDSGFTHQDTGPTYLHPFSNKGEQIDHIVARNMNDPYRVEKRSFESDHHALLMTFQKTGSLM